MREILTQLKKLNEQKDVEALKEYVSNLETEEITSFLKEYINLPNGIQLLNCVLQYFNDNISSHRKRCQIVLSVLKSIEDKETTNSQCNAIVTRLSTHFPKFKTEHLVQILDYCVQKIQSGNFTYMSWKDVFPDVLNNLVERDCVTYNNTDMSGIEFKKQIINTLCMISWSPNLVTMLAAMFTEISLTKEEHLQVVSKLGQCMEKLTCQEIPAYTYQLLKLCRDQNNKIIFLRLQYYFSTRIYKKLSTALPESSDVTDLDEIGDSTEQDAREAESTVLFHIYKHASIGYDSIKEYLNTLKGMKTAPEFVLHPFQLTVLLTLSTISHYEEPVFEILRQCVSRHIQEDFKRDNSAWFQEIAPNPMKIENAILYIIENGISERELVVVGLVNLGFIFLGVKVALGTRHIAERHWELGNLILLKLVKRKRDAANTIIQQLCNLIITGQNVSQYTDCLYNMSRNLTLVMLENQSIIIQLNEQLAQISGNTAKSVIDAILPLVKVSSAIRDNLILMLRKALLGKMVETRQMAVTGFLKLLKNLRVSNLAAWSQSGSSSSSAHSFITQLSIDCRSEQSSKVNNEALCLEVLSILRRCLMQQAEVRMQFYEGLYEAVCMNSELGIPVLDLLWIHFNKFYAMDEDSLPPLDFSKIVLTKNVDVVLQEPIGQLIYSISLILTKVKETVNADNASVKKFETILQSLTERMSNCELIHFELDDGTDLTDCLPESQTKLHILKQAMTVYEALMGYLICSWSSKSENHGKSINNLFQVYSRLSEFLKNINRPKKAEAKKKGKDETEKNKTTKAKNAIKTPTIHVLDFQVISKILSMLHETTISWATVAQTNVLKIKREFHRYILNVALHLIQNIKNTKLAELKYTNVHFNYCVEIASIIYDRIIVRLDCVIDFDCQTSALAVELFHNILTFIIAQYKDKLSVFLCKVSSKDRDTNLGELLYPFIEVYQKLVTMEENEALSDDADGKKIPVTLVNTFSLLVMHLPKERPETLKILDWLKHYLEENTLSNRNVANALLPLWFNLHVKCKTTGTLFENIATRLCDVIGTVNSEIKPECPAELKSINEGTVLNTLSVLTNTLKTLLDEIDWLINRFRSEYSMIIFPGEDKIERRREQLKAKERDLCCHVGQITVVCQLLSNLGVPNGTYTEVVIKILIHLYNTLSILTKYFMMRSSKVNPAFQSARFERVVKLSGKQLNNIISDFILSIEQNQIDPDTQAKKQKVDGNVLKSKVLKDTRLIPKLVYEIEQYGKNIIQLSNKTKVDLSKFIGPGTSRDFRIKAPNFKAALEKINTSNETYMTADENNESVENDDDVTVNEDATVNDDSMEVDEDNSDKEDSDKENESEQDENAPPKKKAKK